LWLFHAAVLWHHHFFYTRPSPRALEPNQKLSSITLFSIECLSGNRSFEGQSRDKIHYRRGVGRNIIELQKIKYAARDARIGFELARKKWHSWLWYVVIYLNQFINIYCFTTWCDISIFHVLNW
jgi:hypothetical protein